MDQYCRSQVTVSDCLSFSERLEMPLKPRWMWTQRGQMKGVLSWLIRCAFCVLSWLLRSAQYKIFFSSPYTIYIPLSPSPSKLGRQPCWVACLLVCVSGFQVQGEFGRWHPGWGRENCKPFFTVLRSRTRAKDQRMRALISWRCTAVRMGAN
jgi:hypothetical protein